MPWNGTCLPPHLLHRVIALIRPTFVFLHVRTSRSRRTSAKFSIRDIVIARSERGGRAGTNRGIVRVVIPVKFSRPTFPPTNRSGGQVDGKERYRITRLIHPLPVLPPGSPRLVLAIVASSTSASSSRSPPSSLTSCFLCFLRHRRRNGFLPSRADSRRRFRSPGSCSCTLCACSSLPARGWPSPARWQHLYRYPASHLHGDRIYSGRFVSFDETIGRHLGLSTSCANRQSFTSNCLTVDEQPEPLSIFSFFSPKKLNYWQANE